MKKDNIEIPELEFINKEINEIVSKGVKPKESFFRYLINIIKNLGFKNIFHDKIQIILILVVLFIFNLIFLSQDTMNIDGLYVTIFILTPITYLIIALFSYFNSKQSETFDIEMVCKYNIYQILAVRMFIFSIISILMNCTLIFILYINNKKIDLIRTNIIAITALFIFSAILLYAIVNIRKNYVKYIIIIGWFFINVTIKNIGYEKYIEFLKEAPLYIHIGVSIISICIYIYSLRKLINIRRNKGEM